MEEIQMGIENVNNDMSPTINELAGALSKAQGQMGSAKKDQNNPFFKSKYADLASVWDAARKPLSDNGLAVVQTTSGTDSVVTVITSLIHSSGQWMRGTLQMRPVKPDPQGVGSCITYARRYALAAMVGIAPEDDDGNAASKPDTSKASKKVEQDLITEAQIFILSDMIAEVGASESDFCKYAKIEALECLHASRFEGAKAYIQKMKKKEEQAA